MSTAEAERRPGRRAEVIYCVLVLILFAVVGFVLWYRAYYNILPGQDATARVHWCERDYQNFGDPPETWRQATDRSRASVRGFGRYPPLGVPGQQLYAALSPDAQPSSCAAVVFLRTGPDRYQPYILLGGP